MSVVKTALAVAALTLAAGTLVPQQPAAAPAAAAAPDTSRMTAQQLGLSVYPAQGQSPQQFATDQAQCYDWSAEQVGYRITPGSVNANAQAAGQAAAAQAEQATQGAAVVGAAGGAAKGAMVAAVFGGDAGTGAAIGATAGAVAGRRARRRATENAGQQAASQTASQQVGAFKQAMHTCLQGRHYTVN